MYVYVSFATKHGISSYKETLQKCSSFEIMKTCMKLALKFPLGITEIIYHGNLVYFAVQLA